MIRYDFAQDTEPHLTPPTCSVWVNGSRLADGQLGEADEDPVVLDDLAITWGRGSALDQPSPSSCTFRLMDRAGGQSFLSAIKVGDRVDIHTDADVYGEPVVPMLPADPFAAAYLTGGWFMTSTLVAPTGGTGPIRIYIPPAARSSDVSAWNSIPRAKPSQTWTAYLTVTFQTVLGATVQAATLAPLYYKDPDGTGVVVGPVIATAGPGIAGMQPLTARFQPPGGVWVGLLLTLHPTGPAWGDVPSSTLWSSLGDTPTWDTLGRFTLAAADTSLLAPPAGAAFAALAFSGYVTDLHASYDIDIGATIVKVTTQDHTAELGNRYVGDVPWAASSLAARFAAIMTKSQSGIAYTVDAAPGLLPVTYRDVDAQPATSLLQELASSVGGVLWSATDLVSGPYLRLEGVDTRPPLSRLVLAEGVVVITPLDPVAGTVTVSACSLLLEPVEWIQATEDASTRVAVDWLEQGVDDKGKAMTTTRTALAIDDDLEAATGRRRIGISSQLADEDAAYSVAYQVLARVAAGGWRISGLTWRMDPDEPLTPAELLDVLKILDGTTRNGLPMLLVDLPEWSPIGTTEALPLYLEGGRYSNVGGYWTLELLVSDATSQGRAGIQWRSVPVGWRWIDFDPAIAWSDLAGVGI